MTQTWVGEWTCGHSLWKFCLRKDVSTTHLQTFGCVPVWSYQWHPFSWAAPIPLLFGPWLSLSLSHISLVLLSSIVGASCMCMAALYSSGSPFPLLTLPLFPPLGIIMPSIMGSTPRTGMLLYYGEHPSHRTVIVLSYADHFLSSLCHSPISCFLLHILTTITKLVGCKCRTAVMPQKAFWLLYELCDPAASTVPRPAAMKEM